MKIIGIYLAAGQSKRFGPENKLMMDVGGIPLCLHAFKQLCRTSLSEEIVVAQDKDKRFWQQQSKTSPVIVAGRASQSKSIKVGMNEAIILGADAAMVVLADQPFVTTGALNKLIEQYRHHPNAAYIAYQQQQVIAPPLLLSSRLFPAVLSLTGDVGARAIIKRYQNEAILESLPRNSKLFFDIDTKEDYRGFCRLWGQPIS